MIRRWRCTPRRIIVSFLAAICASLLLFHYLLQTDELESHVKQPLNGDEDSATARQSLLQRPLSDHPSSSNKSIIRHWPSVEGLKLKNYSALSVHESMTDTDVERTFHEYGAQLHATCLDHARVGNKSDGGWDICLAGAFRPAKPCLVYSFGIGDNWSFDDEMAFKYGCAVRSFDPSINKADHLRGDRIWFYNVGIGKENAIDADNGWKVKTLSRLLSMCHDDGKVIDYLKLDVEGNEWGALENMLEDGVLTNVKQLAIEIHTREVDNLKSSRDDLLRYGQILQQLELIGFRSWYWHFNIWGFFPARDGARYWSCCYELVFINVNFL